MKYPSILLGAVQSCMKRQSVVEALITSPSVDRDVNFKSSAHTEISIKFIPSVKGLKTRNEYLRGFKNLRVAAEAATRRFLNRVNTSFWSLTGLQNDAHIYAIDQHQPLWVCCTSCYDMGSLDIVVSITTGSRMSTPIICIARVTSWRRKF